MDSLRKRLLAAAWVSGAAGLAMSTCASAAETAAEPALGEVVVTAQRRAENIQDVPISIVAISGETVEKAGLTDFQNLTQYTAGLVTDANGDARAARIGLRGVTTAQENGKQSSVGVFIDGVFMSRVGMAFTELQDIERIEVLRGPQGTLFGMNTSAGLIHIITAKPSLDEVRSFIEGVVGNYDRKEARGSISGPIVPGVLAGSFSAFGVQRDGIIRNTTQGRDVDDLKRYGVRGKLRYARENLDVVVIADYTREDSECCVNIITFLKPGATILGTPAAPLAPVGYPFAREAVTGGQNFNNNHGSGLSAEVNYTLGGGQTLTSLTASRRWDLYSLNDPDSVRLNLLDGFIITQGHRQFSQEFRLASATGERLEWVAGLFYFHRRSTASSDITFPAALRAPGQNGHTLENFAIKDDSYAAFGQVSYRLTDTLKVSLGGRYSREEQDARSVQVASNRVSPSYDRAASRNEGQFTYTLNATYDFSPDVMVYGSVARGFKPGGFDLGRPLTFTEFQFEEETNLNTEVGIRTTLLDRRLLLNATVFNTVYKNFQTLQFDGIRFLSGNAPKFRTRGLELEVVARPAAGLSISAQAAFIDAKYTDFRLGACPQGVAGACDLTGRTLPQAPKRTLSSSVSYERPLGDTQWSGFVLAEFSYRSAAYFNQALDPNLRQKAYGLVNLRVGVLNRDGLKVEGWMRNVFDKDYVTFAFNSPLLSGGYAGFLGEPRTYGLRVRKEF